MWIGQLSGSMIYLDTHVVVWLYARLFEKLSPTAELLLNRNDLLVSPLVKLELKYLHEIKRISELPTVILNALEEELGIRTKSMDLGQLIEECQDIEWTRDPFDRMIVAQAKKKNCHLLTRDELILTNFSLARW